MVQGYSPGMGGVTIQCVRVLASVVWLLAGMASASPVLAQKAGGVLKVHSRQPGQHVDPRGSDLFPSGR